MRKVFLYLSVVGFLIIVSLLLLAPQMSNAEKDILLGAALAPSLAATSAFFMIIYMTLLDNRSYSQFKSKLRFAVPVAFFAAYVLVQVVVEDARPDSAIDAFKFGMGTAVFGVILILVIQAIVFVARRIFRPSTSSDNT